MPSSEYLSKKQQEERHMLALEEQARLDAQMQELADEWIARRFPPIWHDSKQPAIVELAGLVRKQAFGKLMLPASLTEDQQQDLLGFLYEEVDGTHFDHMDPDFWQEGTHGLEYLKEVQDE